MDGLLILPAGRTRDDGPFPLVTLVHGGPYSRHADEFAITVVDCGQWLATAGYAVAVGQAERFKAAMMGAGISDWGMQAGTGDDGKYRIPAGVPAA
ncbi:hypothetical protein ABZ636_39950 [Streptomyces sp. NPDC007251]|uniref:alpha/beta hydrolase family protein n=1 Tax=unclassified Streptomyces TaxID=2593676 RepID=UPI0033E8592B